MKEMKQLFSLFTLLCASIGAFCAQPTGETYKIAANPKAGFEWPYLLYVPQNIDRSVKLPILFTMNDSGIFDSAEELEKETCARFNRGEHESVIACGVGVPMVVPLIPRKEGPVNAHDLNRAVFQIQEGPLKRLDLQVLAMLKDARKQLAKQDIRTQRKFLVSGFSSAGSFGWKLTLLHPKKVLALVAGGETYPTLPASYYDTEELIFPVGVADFKKFTGKTFDKKAWNKIPIFLFNGEYDYNDPMPFDDIYGEEEKVIVKQILGDNNIQARWKRARELLQELAPSVQTHTYPNTEHEPVATDMIAFLQTHIHGGPLHPIVPQDTSVKPSWLPLKATALYWGQQAPFKHDREYLEDTDLIVEIPITHWRSWIRGACSFDIMQDGQVILPDVKSRGAFSENQKKFLQISLDKQEVKRLKSMPERTFSLRSNIPQVVAIPAELTFTIPKK